jgi:hypothetical protein
MISLGDSKTKAKENAKTTATAADEVQKPKKENNESESGILDKVKKAIFGCVHLHLCYSKLFTVSGERKNMTESDLFKRIQQALHDSNIDEDIKTSSKSPSTKSTTKKSKASSS